MNSNKKSRINQNIRRVRPPYSKKVLWLWLFFLVTGLVFFQVYEYQKKSYISKFNYPKFLDAVEAGDIKPGTVVFNTSKHEISGEMTEAGHVKWGAGRFRIQGNVSDKGFEILKEKGLPPSYVYTDHSLLTSFFLNWLPVLLILGFLFFFIKQLQIGGKTALSFGKSRARLAVDKKHVTFKDVAGVEEAKDELSEIVEFLKNPKKFTRLGGRIPKGVLLIGAPGTGKTLLAKAVAGEADVPFFTISGSDFVEMFVGVGASRVRDLFIQGRKSAPCVIFIDEIDAVGRHRGSGMGGGHDEREQTLNQLLVEMDGFESYMGIILIAATNRPDVLDPALLRPGRFDRRVVVNSPDLSGRHAILKVHTKKVPLSKSVDLKKIARGTPGFSGADLENLINESALMAAYLNKDQIEMSDIEKAKDKVIMGRERKSMVISPKDRELTAYHEAGHTIVGKQMPNLDPIHKVTIIPRGMALGVTQTLPTEDSLNLTKSKAQNTLAFLFGGRAAEELIFKDYTTGAGNDIEKATDLARRMVCEWGMSEKLGPLALQKKETPFYMGMIPQGKDYSESKAEEVDQEIKRLIQTAHKKAFQILQEKKDILHVMAKALLEYETINGEEVDHIMKGSSLKDIAARRQKEEETLSEERQARKSENKIMDSKEKTPSSPEVLGQKQAVPTGGVSV